MESKRTQFFKALAGFREYCEEVDIYKKPVKGESCDFGAAGMLFQAEVGKYLGLVQGNLSCRTAVRSDFYAGGLVLEVKQGASMVDIIYNARKKVDYVCYSPDYRPGYPVEATSYVLSRQGFQAVLEKAGLLRRKVGNNGGTHLAIQSYRNSRKKYELFLDLLDEYNEMTLEEYRNLIQEKGKRA